MLNVYPPLHKRKAARTVTKPSVDDFLATVRFCISHFVTKLNGVFFALLLIVITLKSLQCQLLW